MKKIVSVLLLICITCLSGCADQGREIIGSEQIEALRNEAAAYESGRYFIENLDSGVLEQVFSFYYDDDDRQVYLCEGDLGGEYYAEYSNGVELFREENGVSANIGSTDETYAKYTKKNPHPYSTGQLLFYIKNYVGTSEQTADEDGNTVYIHRYDVEKLNKVLDSDVTVFYTYYAFDSEGRFKYFCQHNESAAETDADGNPVSYTYQITLGDVNSVTEIENPVSVDGQNK
ncbi:MAG: hypothetical protein IJ007_02590 [Oscillospiraceae bacterium]|nr:hypothetical protein [Oscillospiraceae bacterium]